MSYRYADLKHLMNNYDYVKRFEADKLPENIIQNYEGEFSEMTFKVGDKELGKLKHMGWCSLWFFEEDGTKNKVANLGETTYLFDNETKNYKEIPNKFDVVLPIVC
jgi:hypothetical protein